MKLYARWYGEWSNGKNDYRYQSLERASAELGIEESEYHRAADDALNALSIMRAISSRTGNHAPPADMPYHERYYGH